MSRSTTKLISGRAVATRFDKLLLRYEATVQIATSGIWLRRLARTSS